VFTFIDCLQSNCTGISGDEPELKKLLTRIPYYIFCNQWFAYYYYPMITMYPFGLVVVLWTVGWVAVSTIVWLTLGLFYPLETKALDDIQSPEDGIREFINQQHLNLNRFRKSLENFDISNRFAGFRHQIFKGEMWHNLCSKEAIRDAIHHYRYFPIQFTDWWRKQAMGHYKTNFRITVFFFILASLLSIAGNEFVQRLRLASFEDIAAKMHEENCYIWRNTPKANNWTCSQLLDRDGLDEREIISIEKQAYHPWSMFTTAENFFIWIFPTILSATNYCSLLHTSLLIRVKIFELKEKSLIVLNIWQLLSSKFGFHVFHHAKRIREYKSFHPSKRYPPLTSEDQCYSCQNIRMSAKFQTKVRKHLLPNIRIAGGLIHFREKQSSFEQSILKQSQAFEWLNDEDFDPNSLVSLLEHLNLELWNLELDFKSLNGTCSRSLLIFYSITYSATCATAIWQMTFNEESSLAIFAVIISSSMTNFSVAICSSLHASASSVTNIFWSLVAQLHYASNWHHRTDKGLTTRLDHARVCYLKQIAHLDSKESFSIKLMGRFSVTYVGIIKLILWSSSIVLIAYARY